MTANSQRSRKAGNGVGTSGRPSPDAGTADAGSLRPLRTGEGSRRRARFLIRSSWESVVRVLASPGAHLCDWGGLPRGLGRPPPPPDFPASEASTASCLTEAFAARLPRVRDPAEDQGPCSPPGPSGLRASGKIPQPLSLMTLTFVEEHSPFFFSPFK